MKNSDMIDSSKNIDFDRFLIKLPSNNPPLILHVLPLMIDSLLPLMIDSLLPLMIDSLLPLTIDSLHFHHLLFPVPIQCLCICVTCLAGFVLFCRVRSGCHHHWSHSNQSYISNWVHHKPNILVCYACLPSVWCLWGWRGLWWLAS